MVEHLLVDKTFHQKNIHNIRSENCLHWASAYARECKIHAKELYEIISH